MRQKAEKLEKGKWYCDSYSITSSETLLKYENSDDKNDFFSDMIGYRPYMINSNGFIGFIKGQNQRYIPTQEDREKYNLVDDE